MNDFKLPPEAVLVILAIFGGIARYLDLFLKSNKPIVWFRFVSTIIVSAFSGYMTAQVAILLYPDWVFVAAGIGGYASTRFLDIGTDLLKQRFGINTGFESRDSDNEIDKK